jgi:hemerythrin-like metal-binding protein
MAIAKWSDELTTGVTEVDTQHKELIRLVNDFHEALMQGKGREVVGDAIHFLSDYVVKHFQMEERLMLDNHYPGYVAHKGQHEQFIKDFTKLANDFNTAENSSLLAINVQRSIMQWLINHIMKVDKEMAKYLIARSSGNAA